MKNRSICFALLLLSATIVTQAQSSTSDAEVYTVFDPSAPIRATTPHLDGMIARYTQAIKINPKDADAYYNRGNARREKKDFAGAIDDYTQAINIDPSHAKAYYNRGYARHQENDTDGGIADYTRAIEINPRYADAYINRGFLRQVYKKDVDGGIADFTQAINIDPNNAKAYRSRAFARSDKRDADGQIADFTQVIRIDPSALSYNGRGVARSEKGDRVGAIADYTRAIEIAPKNVTAYINRGSSRYKMGDFSGAVADFTHVLAINPNDWISREHLETAKARANGISVEQLAQRRMETETTRFRLGLKMEDETNCGLVIEMKGGLVKIYFPVANYGNEHWVQKNRLFPPGYGCRFINGRYQPPYDF